MKIACQRGAGDKLYPEVIVEPLLGESIDAGRERGKQELNLGAGLQDERITLLAPKKVIMPGDLVRVIDAVENKIIPAVVKNNVSYTYGDDGVVTCNVTIKRQAK